MPVVVVARKGCWDVTTLGMTGEGVCVCVCVCVQGDMVRIGGLLFGILPAAGGVKQALAAAGAAPQRAIRWLTTVVSIKSLPPHSCVGYECAATTSEGPVAMLPLGSHDGLLEPSAGFRHVVIRGHLRPVLAVGPLRVRASRQRLTCMTLQTLLSALGEEADVCVRQTRRGRRRGFICN